MTHPTHITIATRESELAIWQAEYIKSELVSLYPRLEVTILGMTTQGDKTLNKSLSKDWWQRSFHQRTRSRITK